MSLYGYAALGSAGLANRLFPWARCEIFCHRHHARMLAPQWIRLKIGPLLRGEKDWRFYFGLFDNSGYVRGPARTMVLMTRRKITESQLQDAPPPDGSVTIFEGMAGEFTPLWADRELVCRRLWEIVNPKLRRVVEADRADFVIGVHVRRSDMVPLKFGEPFTPGVWNRGHADQWFINCINNLRRMLGRPAPVRIFSDARPHELQALLELENVALATENPSVADLFLLSKSRILITTSTSSFSWWASFIGRMPSVWYPGLMSCIKLGKSGKECEADLQGNIPGEFAQVVRSI